MAYPTDPSKGYSFTDFADGQGDNSFPGTQMDGELQKLFASDVAIINFLETSALRSDGGIKAGTVEYSALGNSVLQYFAETLGYLGPFDGTIDTDVSMNGHKLLGIAAGSSGAPGIAFTGDYADFGFYITSGGGLGVSADSQTAMQFWSTYVRPTLPLRVSTGSAAAPAYSFFDDPDCGWDYVSANNTMALYTSGVERFSINSTRSSFAQRLLAPEGDAATPTYTWTGRTGYGLYYYATEGGGIGFALGGVLGARLTTNGGFVTTGPATLTGLFMNGSGTSSDPAISFAGDTNLGIYRVGPDALGFTAGGTRKMRIDGDSVRVDGALTAPALSTGTGTALVVTGGGDVVKDSSSRRYKTEIRPYERGLADLMKLRPKLYQMKEARGPWHAGLIAEELLEAGFPEFVTRDRDDRAESIREAKMGVSLVVNAVQELARRVETLEMRA